jgi:plasmid stabilization system protein ParE
MEWTSERYSLTLSPEAEADFLAYVDYIIYTCDAPKTGKKHTEELRDELRKIQKNPTTNSIRTSASLLQYGNNIRRVNYKKMAIIYTVTGFLVYVHRIIPASMVVD